MVFVFFFVFLLWSVLCLTTIYNSAICCRGYESCAYSTTLFSNLGNIFCVGDFSCGDSRSIWTNDYTQTNGNNTDPVAIYCMAYSSCLGSSLESADTIMCGVYFACKTAEISSAQTLYCTYQACNSAVIRKVDNVYIYDTQDEVTIRSGSVGIMNINLKGKGAGDNLALTCNEGDVCYVNCGKDACNSSTTTLTCYGKCFVTCDENNGSTDCVNILVSVSPSMAPSSAPSMSPTLAPIDADGLTEQDIVAWFNWTLFGVAFLVTIVIIFGCLDSRKWRKNELFVWQSIILCGFYSVDFAGDVFFSMRLFLLIFDDELQQSGYTVFASILFILSMLFLIIPLIANLYQLHKELSKWLIDSILVNTDVPLWILTYSRFLYFTSVISGSSFSAVTLFNSNLFQWRIFGMGLSRYHRKKFRNKRFFSVVLLENVPQLFLQILALILISITQMSNSNNDDYSSLLITIFSMIFTMISILLCVFEYFLSNKFIYMSSSIMISFVVESTDAVELSYRQFNSKIVFRQWKLIGNFAKLLSIRSEQVERLKPILVKNGIRYTFAIAADPILCDTFKDTMIQSIRTGYLAKVCECCV